MSQEKKKNRDSNIELYRIIVMLLIVCYHYVIHSGIIEELSANPLSAKSLFFYVFGMWGKIGINCFVLITGYYMCKSTISLRKFLKLLVEIEFYNVLIFIIFACRGEQVVSVNELFNALVPMNNVTINFIGCYLWFYLFIPFLTNLVANMNKKQHANLIILCLLLYTLIAKMPNCKVVMNHVTWYSILFIIGSYIRFYGLSFNFKRIGLNSGGAMAASILLSVFSVLIYVFLQVHLKKHVWPYNLVIDVNAPFAVLTAITSFVYFKDLKIKYNKWINKVAASTFGVLCIHDNSFAMREWVWKVFGQCPEYYASSLAIVHALAYVVLIFVTCIAIDYLRIQTLEKWIFYKKKL